MYKLAQTQLAEAHAQLEARAKQLAALQHDKDELLRHVETKSQQAEVSNRGDGARRYLHALPDSSRLPGVDLPTVGCKGVALRGH